MNLQYLLRHFLGFKLPHWKKKVYVQFVFSRATHNGHMKSKAGQTLTDEAGPLWPELEHTVTNT